MNPVLLALTVTSAPVLGTRLRRCQAPPEAFWRHSPGSVCRHQQAAPRAARRTDTISLLGRVAFRHFLPSYASGEAVGLSIR
jgi:hypothetical protein